MLDTLEKKNEQLFTYQQELEGKVRELALREEELQNHRQHLSELVEERTADLRRTNKELQQEIVEREMAEKALRESEEKFRTLAETANAAIFIYQSERTIYANPAAVVITGYSEAELPEMNFWNTIHADFQPLLRERSLARQRGEPVETRYEVKIVTKNSQVRWLDFTGGLIEYQGKPAVLGTAFDITEASGLKRRYNRHTGNLHPKRPNWKKQTWNSHSMPMWYLTT